MLTFKITTPAIRDRRVEAGDLDRETTPWGGMSGAVIVTRDGQIVGVVRGHAPAAGVGSLTFTPLAAIDALPAETGGRVLGAGGCGRSARVAGAADAEDRRLRRRSWWGRSRPARRGLCTASAVDRLAGRLDDATVAVVCALTGMRGVGKTHVAAAYARSWIEAGRGLVGWVNAETLDVAVADLARIAEAVGVADPEGDSAILGAAARRASGDPGRGESAGVRQRRRPRRGCAPICRLLGRTRVVITTTDTAFTEFGDVVDIERFTRPESVHYLRERTGIDDAAGAAELAGELGDLPLALAAAASTIRQRRYRDYSPLSRAAAQPTRSRRCCAGRPATTTRARPPRRWRCRSTASPTTIPPGWPAG